MIRPRTILIVEDEPTERDAMARLLRVENYEVLAASNPQEALSLADANIDLVVSDLRMGAVSGLDLLRAWKERLPGTPFFMLTAYGDIATAVEAMKLGAKDFLTKPVRPAELLSLIKKILDSSPESWSGPLALDEFAGHSPAMQEIRDFTRLAAQADTPVLIVGEPGTGTERAAWAIHRQSQRKDSPYTLINVASIPKTIIDRELFGHARGAFPGAIEARAGRILATHSGSLFIDEIGGLGPQTQARLLQAVEQGSVVGLGENEERRVDVRLIAATSLDLAALAARGEFRRDLFYRLNVLTVRIPPLRERREDIPLVVEAYLRAISRSASKPAPSVSGELLEFLVACDWPGNLRQLGNVLESMFLLSPAGELGIGNLPRHLVAETVAGVSQVALQDDRRLEDLERSAVIAQLQRCQGNRTRAAKALGISVRTLQRWLKAWGLHE